MRYMLVMFVVAGLAFAAMPAHGAVELLQMNDVNLMEDQDYETLVNRTGNNPPTYAFPGTDTTLDEDDLLAGISFWLLLLLDGFLRRLFSLPESAYYTCVMFLLLPAAVILGVIGLAEIRRGGGRLGGTDMAVGGIVFGLLPPVWVVLAYVLEYGLS